jgi:hypothetical protein
MEDALRELITEHVLAPGRVVDGKKNKSGNVVVVDERNYEK